MKINDSNMSTSELSSLTSSNASRVHLAHGEQNEHSSHNSNINNNNNHSMSCNDFLLQSSLVNGANFQYMPKCPLCDKTFANSSNLKHHMNTIHFNEAKWICNECGKVCTSKSNLKVHLRVHLRVKPYYCRWCDYNCMHHSSIRDHLSKCHPEKSHNSSEPGYIFNSAAVPEPELSNYDLTLKNFESSESQNTSMQLQDINNNNKKQTQTNMNIKTESYSSEDNIKHSADLGKHDPNESTTTNKSKLIKHHENNIHHHQHQHHHHLNNSKSNLPIISNKKKKPNKIRKLEESFLLSYKNDNKKSHHDATLNNTTNKTNNNLINGADNQNADFENSHSDSESSGCHHPHPHSQPHAHLQKDVCPIGNNTHFSPYHDDSSIKPTCSSLPPAISSFLFSPSLTGFPSSAASDLLNNLLQNSNIFKQFTQSSSTSANNQINNLTANLIQRLNATAFMNQLNNNNSLPSISNQQVGQNCPLSTAVAANASANNNNLKTKHLDANGLNALDLTTSQEKKKLKLSSTSNSEHAGVEESPVSPASSLSSSISASSSESSASASSLSSSTHFSPTSMQSTNSTNSTTSTLKTASKPNSKILNKSNKKAISDVINRLNLNLPNRIKKSHNTAAETTDQKTSQIKHEHEHDNDDDHEQHEFSTSNGRSKNIHDDNNMVSPHHFYASNEIKHETTNDDDDNDDDPDADEHFDNFKTSETNDNKHFVEMTSLSQRQQQQQQQQNSNATNNDIDDDNNENTSCSYKCKYCNIIFDEYSLYSIHAGMHSNTNPWKCNVCGHVCSNKVDFAVHILHLPKI